MRTTLNIDGELLQRARRLTGIQEKTALVRATDEEEMRLIEERQLWGRGIGWIDVHLIVSGLLTGCRFWTLDRQFARTASVVESAPTVPHKRSQPSSGCGSASTL